MKFEISHFSLYDLNDFSPHIVKLFRYLSVSCLLSMLMVAPAYAQFTLLPSTSKTIAECNDPSSVFSQFLLTGQFPESSDVNNAQNFVDAQNNQNDTKAKFDAIVTQSKSTDEKLKAAQNIYDNCIKSGNACGAEKSVISDIQGQVQQNDAAYTKAQKDLQDANTQFSAAQAAEAKNSSNLTGGDLASAREDILACAIKTGRASLSLIPYFITYIINFALGMVGLISVLFIVIGGYRYVVGGLGEDKEKGKKTISSALMGMGLALLAWSIVNIILKAITG